MIPLMPSQILKFISASFVPITMFKQQSVSFHIVSKTFITQNYLVFISSNFLCLLLRSCIVLHIFNPEIVKANTILNKNIAGIIQVMYVNALA